MHISIQTAKIEKIPFVGILKYTSITPNTKNKTIKMFWKKLLPARTRPICFSGVKNCMFAFNGTMKIPPLNPNANEPTHIQKILLAFAKIKTEINSPNEPKGTIPISMCFLQ